MESFEIGDRVNVTGTGPSLDGIVFDTPSRTKAVVAVVDPGRGPRFRTVDTKSLTERTEDGPQDHALKLLIRRTPAPGRRGARGGSTGTRGSAGFTRGPAHRPTGR